MTRRDDFSQALRSAAPPPMAPEADDLDALGVARLIRRRFWLIAGVAALAVGLALPSILAMKPTYYAGSRLLIQNPLTTALASSAEDRIVRLNLTTEVERLLSREMALKVIRELDIDARPEFNPALRAATWTESLRNAVRRLVIPSDPAGAARPSVDPVDQVIPEYMAALGVIRDPTSDVVRIEFVSEDAQLAAAVPNTVLRVYLTEREADLARDVGRADDWLADRVAEQTVRVEAAKTRVESYEKASGLASADERISATQLVTTLTQLRTELARKRAELTAALADLDSATTPSDKIALIDSPVLSEVNRDLELRRYTLDRLRQTYGDNHPEVAAARSAVETGAARLDGDIGRYIRSLRIKLAKLAPEDAALETELAAAAATLARLDAAETRRDELKRLSDVEQEALERLEAQGRALSAEGKLPVADVEVLSPATPPLAPTGRGKTFYLLAAAVAATMLGLTAACGVELADRSVRSADQLQDVAGIEPCAMAPRIPRRIAGSLSGLVAHGHEGMFGDAIRALLMSLRLSGNGVLPASLLVTSPSPDEGKSLIAAALAVELAATGQRVLLVDADLPHGGIHRLFGVSEGPGFADYLRGDVELAEVIRHDPKSGIDYIVRGARKPGRPRESDRVKRLLEAARQGGRLVIFDSAPVFASIEAARLAAWSERTLLAIRWGRTTRDAVQTALRQLRGDFSQPALGIINMVDPRRHALYGFRDADSFSRTLRRYQDWNA